MHKISFKPRIPRDHADAAAASDVFVDISSQVNSRPSEAGLLGIAFHPRFQQNGLVFLSYTTFGGQIDLTSRISRFVVKGGCAQKTSEKVLLTFPQPFGNHNGGGIFFGPDGFLYARFGDGGSGGDPLGNGQKKDTLFGKILRIDVDVGETYGIPPDNPFAQGGGAPEVWAYGLRNPWRFSFDRETGDLWAADVGQDKWEEVDLIVKGGNYGWNAKEGAHCFKTTPCDVAGLIDPVAEYAHPTGHSVTGGYVYRGKTVPGLQGAYLYADFVSGKMWGLFKNAAGTFEPKLLSETGLSISSFGEGADGELYILDYGTGGIFKIVPPG